MSRATYISALMLSVVSLSICFGSGGDWQYVLDLLNSKRSDVGKEPVSVSHPEDIDMEGVSTIKAGTEEILLDYGFTGLADALNYAGYTQSTWSEGFDCKNEIYNILNLMHIRSCTYYDLIVSSTSPQHPGIDVSPNICFYNRECTWGGMVCRSRTDNIVVFQSVEDYVVNLKGNFGRIILEEEIQNSPAGEKNMCVWCQPYPPAGPYCCYYVTVLPGSWYKPQLLGSSGGTVTFIAPLHSQGDGKAYNVRWTYSYHTCSEKVPRASFTYSPENPLVGEEITFDASSSHDSDGAIVSYEWNFGDTNSASGQVVTHAYAKRGEYSVTLTVTDNDGLEGFLSKTIIIGTVPVASFTYSPVKPMVGGIISFDASDSNDPDGTILSYEWDWGDGTSDPPSSGPNAMHMFTTPEKYTVTLTVTDNDGLTNSKSIEIDLTLENGDLLLCRDFVSLVPDFWSFWSHIGIYNKASNTVIEARPIEGGVWHYPLSDWFFSNKTYARVLRINTSQAVKDAAADFASAQADSWSPYDLFSILIPLPLLGMKNQDNSDGLGWYCSELIWAAYLQGSNGSVNLDMDAFAVSPEEIADSSWIEKVVGEHMETEPPETVYQGGGVLFGEALCPINLLITDPDGLVLSKSVNAIPGAVYRELDFDHDGDLDDAFMIPKRKMGGYSIGVIPEPNALPTDTYSLEVIVNGQTMVLAEDVQIQDIPTQPYEIESKLCYSDFDGDGDVDFTDYAIFASHWMATDCNYPNWCEGTDLDYSGTVDFNDITISTGDWLWKKIPADIDIDGDIDFTDYALLASRWRYVDCNEPTWCFGADINKSGFVDLYDLAELAAHWLVGR